MAKQDLSTWRVLIVDDEPDNIGVPKQLFEFHGAAVITAKNGVEGLTCLTEERPTVVLLDLSMPEMDGWEMLKQIRDQEETTDLTVIAVTAHAMKGDRQRVMEAGFDGYISKPFRIGSFLEQVKKIVLNEEQTA